MSQFIMKLVRERFSKYALTSTACSSRITTLETKIFDKSMEGKSIVVSILSQLQKVFTRFRDIISMDDNIEIAKIGCHQDTAFPFLLFYHVVYFISDL